MTYRFRHSLAGGGTFEQSAKTEEDARQTIARRNRVDPDTLVFVCEVSRAEIRDRAFRREFGAEIDRLVGKDD